MVTIPVRTVPLSTYKSVSVTPEVPYKNEVYKCMNRTLIKMDRNSTISISDII
jgi:hypothetical protein